MRGLSSSRARLTGKSALSRGESADRRLGGGSFVPWLFAAADEDASLVTLARQEDRVSRASAADGMGDPLPAVLDPRVLLALRPSDLLSPGCDLAEDGHGVLFSWILIGEDGIVAQASRDLAHPWPLLAIAVTGAAEDGDQYAPRDGPQLPKDLLETLRRVRRIDDHGEQLHQR